MRAQCHMMEGQAALPIGRHREPIEAREKRRLGCLPVRLEAEPFTTPPPSIGKAEAMMIIVPT